MSAKYTPRASAPWYLQILSWILLIGLVFSLAGCGRKNEKTGIEKTAAEYMAAMEASVVALEHAMDKVSGLLRLDTKERLRNARKTIIQSRATLKTADKDVAAYAAFVRKHEKQLEEKHLGHYILVSGLFNKRLYDKRAAVGGYLTAMDNWLKYSATNFEKLKTASQSHRLNYDKLLINVNRRIKAYNTANAAYHRFISNYLEKHPQLKKRFKPQYKTMKQELGWL